MRQEQRYVDWDGHRIATVVAGDGPHDVLIAGSWVSHLDLFLGHPLVQEWLRTITRYSRVVMFDKLGVGLSDPVTTLPTLEDRLDELRAVSAAHGLDRPVVVGVSEGAATAIALAALHPSEIRSLVLASPLVGSGGGLPEGTADEIAAQLVERSTVAPPELRPDEAQYRALAGVFWTALHTWGDGSTLEALVPSLGPRATHAHTERSIASPSMVRAVLEASAGIDGWRLATGVAVPTLILHASRDLVPVQGSRLLSMLIPDATLTEIDGAEHAPWLNREGMRTWGPAFEAFVTGHESSPIVDRVLLTVLFTDLVESTRRAAEVGDGRWRSVLGSYLREAAEVVAHHGGTLVKQTGDGVLATFTSPLSAVHAGRELVAAARRFDLEARVGAHTGEVEVVGDDIAGLAVHIAARILDLAEASVFLTSRTVRDLVTGSGVGFRSRGSRRLRDVPDEWELVEVVDDEDGATPDIDPSRPSRWYDRVALAAARRRTRARG